MQSFYTMGAADQVKELTPQIKVKDKIIEEKNELIVSYDKYKNEAEKDIIDKNKAIAALQFKVQDKEKEIDSLKTKTWIATGIGIVTTAFAIAGLVF